MSASRALPRVPDLIARGGNVAEFPGNTLPALRSAVELGARHIEFDVQLTADCQPILLNDCDLLRTAGVDRNALEMNWSELADVLVSEPQRFQERFTDIGIPTLQQAVRLLATHPTVTAFVEIKRASLRNFGADRVIARITEVLKPVVRQCVLVSRDLTAIHKVRQISSCRVGWMLSEYSSLSALKCEALAPEYLFCDRQFVSNGAPLWRGPWLWAIYDVNSREAAMHWAGRGARLVATTGLRRMLREFRSVH